MDIFEIHLDSIDSTNEYAKQNYLSFQPHQITCITAEEQTSGRGRRQRTWVSPKGVNIYATFYFQIPSHTPQLTTLAQVMAFSFATVLLNEGLTPKVKWPNDILLNGKKISGVLCETIFEKHEVSIFLGIGINVNMEIERLLQIDQPATSLKVETNKNWDRKELLKKLTIQFEKNLELFKKEGFAPFRAKIEKILAYKGEVVQYTDGQKKWVGICDSLSLDGGLNLLVKNSKNSSPILYTLLSGDLIT